MDVGDIVLSAISDGTFGAGRAGHHGDPDAGHTPGHLCVVVASGGRRALLLGGAVTCPVQLDEPTRQSIGDVDPDLANRTRERLWRELEGEDIRGTGAHFPALRFGRVPGGGGKRWWT
jgi:hypothetical protein